MGREPKAAAFMRVCASEPGKQVEQTDRGLLVHVAETKSTRSAYEAIAEGEGRVFDSDEELDSYLRSFPEPDAV